MGVKPVKNEDIDIMPQKSHQDYQETYSEVMVSMSTICGKETHFYYFTANLYTKFRGSTVPEYRLTFPFEHSFPPPIRREKVRVTGIL